MITAYNLRGLLSVVFKHKLIILLIPFLFMLAGLYALKSTSDIYQSHGGMLIKFSKSDKQKVNLSGDSRLQTIKNDERSEIINSYVRILKSNSLLSEVVASMGVEKFFDTKNQDIASNWKSLDQSEKLQLATGDVADNLKIINNGEDTVIDIYYSDASRKMSAGFINELMEAFINKQDSLYNSNQVALLDQQILDMQNKVVMARAAMSEFKKENAISNIDHEIEELLKQKTELTKLAYDAANDDLGDARKSLLQAKQYKPVPGANNALAQENYRGNTGASPQVSGNKSVYEAKNLIASKERKLNSVLTGRNSQLASKLNRIDARIADLEANRGRYDELKQLIALSEENYKYYKQRGEEARVNSLLDTQNISTISIIDPALVPTKPEGGANSIIFLAFLMTGICLAFLLAFAREYIDERLSTPEQVKNILGVPVIATFNK